MDVEFSDPTQLFDIMGKSALVVGASGALGRVAALTVGGAGARTTVAAGNREKLDLVAGEMRESGSQVLSVNLRPDTVADAEAIVEAAVSAHGGLDLVIVASGMNKSAKIVDSSAEDFQAIMDANVVGSWNICRVAGAQMISQGRGGKILLISSTRGKLGHPGGYSSYCTSKSAIDGLVRALGCEWGEHNIQVNAIGPTVFRSDLTDWMFSDEEPGKSVRAGMLARIPSGRLGEPDDLAGVILFLISPASDFCTGQIVYVDGGYTAG